MLWCLSCLRPGDLAVCRGCVSTMRAAPRRRLECGIGCPGSGSPGRGAPAGAAPQVPGLSEAAEVLAAVMLPLLPSDALALAPIPRIYSRRLKYRSDPGLLLAGALSRRSGLPVCKALGPRLWGRANAGLGRPARTAPRFRRRWAPPGDWCWSTMWSPPASPWGRLPKPLANPWFAWQSPQPALPTAVRWVSLYAHSRKVSLTWM